MVVLLIIIGIFIIGSFFEKSDGDEIKGTEKLPPFTKEYAEIYYHTELKNKGYR